MIDARDRDKTGKQLLLRSVGVRAPAVHTGCEGSCTVRMRGTKQRNVFKCPQGVACKAEREYRSATAVALVDTTVDPCIVGYDGALCAFCDAGFSMGKSGCKICKSVGEASEGLAYVVAAIVFLLLCKRCYKQRQLKKKHAKSNSAVNVLKILARVLPELVADIKVFIGVFQTMSNMGRE